MARTILRATILGAVAVAFSVAANATIVDLTTSGTQGTLNGGLYVQAALAPTGSGVISSFVRLNTNDPNEQGYNTDGRPLQFDENSSPTFTRSLSLSLVPIITCGAGGTLPGSTATCTAGTQYREFILDINQTNADPLLSLDRVVIYLRSSGALTDSPLANGTQLGGSTLFPTGTLVYDSGVGNRVDLNYTLDSGSGHGDMFLYVPNSSFTGANTFVYLYSEFGLFGAGGQPPYDTNDGFEEWAVRAGPGSPPDVPEPVTSALVGSGLVALFFLRRRAAR